MASHAPDAKPPAGQLTSARAAAAGWDRRAKALSRALSRALSPALSRWVSLVVALLATLCLSSIAAAAPAPPATGAARQGEQVVSWGRMVVAASPEMVFAVLTDYDRMAEFLPGMQTSEVAFRKGHSVVVEQVAEESVLFFSQRIVVRMAIDESPPDRLTLRSLAGSFKEFNGSYELTRMAEGTVIEYRSRFVPEFPLPPVFGMYAVERSLARHLAALAKETRRRAGHDPSSRLQ